VNFTGTVHYRRSPTAQESQDNAFISEPSPALLSASIPITTLLPAQAIDEAALLAIKAAAGGGHGDTLAS